MDRDEFKRRLESIFCLLKTYSTCEILITILKNDTEKLDLLRTEQQALDQKVNMYLTEWDNAPTPEQKMAIVASVTE